MSLVLVVLAVLAACAAYVRLAPSDPERWHVLPQPKPAGDYPGEGRFMAVRDAVPADTLARLDAIAMATPRTARLAGSVGEGRVTYVTRSRFWGFPDYTSFSLEGGTLRIFARLRFGQGDHGVNEARVRGWLGELGL